MDFDKKQFNFSSKWLYKYKLAHNINRVKLHGEGADADVAAVQIVRQQLPRLLADTPLDKIYNFDETGDNAAAIACPCISSPTMYANPCTETV